MKNDVSEEEIMAWGGTLLPGDGLFPAASATPMPGVLKERLIAADGGKLLDRIGAAVSAGGGPLAALSLIGRRAVLETVERNDPKLFEEVRKIFYVTYY